MKHAILPPMAALALMLTVSGCIIVPLPRPAAPDPARAAAVQPVPAPAPAVPSGPLAREPDTCGGQALLGLVGQPAGMVRTVALRGPVRIVAPGQIVSQEEYDSTRVNVHLDADGNIQRIACG